VDVLYELTRDLYEKQRVSDKYLEEHDEDNQLLNQYYSNAYYKAKPIAFNIPVYGLPYAPVSLRKVFRKMVINTSVVTLALSMVNPYLSLLMAYDIYLVLSTSRLLN